MSRKHSISEEDGTGSHEVPAKRRRLDGIPSGLNEKLGIDPAQVASLRPGDAATLVDALHSVRSPPIAISSTFES